MLPFSPYVDQSAAHTVVSSGWTGPSTNLTHRWPMDNANISGLTITDVVAGLNGTSSGVGVTAVAGPSGASNAARGFDGSSTILLASNPFADFTADHSIFCWIKDSDITSGSGIRTITLYTDIAHYTTLVIDNGGTYTAGTFVVQINDSFGMHSNSAAVSNNTWTHLGYTFTGSTITLYKNGSSLAQTSAFDSFSVPAITTSIFAGRDAAARVLPNGSAMAQIVTYNKTLSAGEVTTLYNAF